MSTEKLPRVVLAAIFGFSLLSGSLASADAISDFKKLYTSKNSWEKANAIKTLDPNDPKAFKLLSKLLEREHWYLRMAVIEVLSGAFEAEIGAKMAKSLEKGKGTLAEGIALALGRAGDPSKVPLLIKGLKHKDWRVRRSSALALKNLPDRRAIEALIEAWEAELKKGKHFRVWVRCVEALEEITGEAELPTLEDWKSWWEARRGEFQVGGKKESKGKKSSTVAGVTLDYETRGRGGTLLVLPDYGFEEDYLKTYLRNLEDSNRIIYMSLPGASDFNPALPPMQGAPYPVYPLDKLVEAFDLLVKKLEDEQVEKEAAESGTTTGKKKSKRKRINIFAHGMSGWIGMKYAALKPKRVKKLVLCAPFSSGKAWSDGNNRHVKNGQSSGDIEEEHFAKSRILQNGQALYSAKNEQESDAFMRKKMSFYFADLRDSEIAQVLGDKVEKKVGQNGRTRTFKAYRPMGSVMIPSDFTLFKLNKSPVPTLIMVGKHGVMTSVADCEAIKKHYPNSKLMVFPKSARMPFIEENTKFVKMMAKFVN